MAQCILCKATIPDGTQYCDSCKEKVKNKADESYLDSLLSSVTPSGLDSKLALYKKASSASKSPKKEKTHETKRNNFSEDLFDGIPKDYSIFSKAEDDSDMDFLDEIFHQGMENPEEITKNSRIFHPIPCEEDGKEEVGIEELDKEEVGIEELGIEEAGIEELDKEEAGIEKSQGVTAETTKEKMDATTGEKTGEMTGEKILEETLVDFMNTEPSMEEAEIKESGESKMEEPNTNGDDRNEDDDILELINQISQAEELPEVEELLVENNLGQANQDVGITGEDLLSLIPDINERSFDKETESVVTKEETVQPTVEEKDKTKKKEKREKEKKKKKNFFARIFGNIREEYTEEEINALHEAAIKEGEAKILEKKEKAELAKQKKEQDKLKKAEDAQKAKEDAAKKKAIKAQKVQEKKDAKEQRVREIQELIDEIDENEGKINKVGAGIIFAFFAAIAVVIVVGTNMYTYTISIQNATQNFRIQHYNEAYKNVYGIEIKDEDIGLYDRIMTVMYVNQQLNSYKSYYNMQDYPKALDSLLKGLERYDKYYDLATQLGIESDLDFVKQQILDELINTFRVTEKEAGQILGYKDQMTYSTAVYMLAIERIPVLDKTDTSENTN